MRSFLTPLVALALVVLPAVPAFATVSKWGTRYCSEVQTPYTEACSTGFTHHLPPGIGYAEFDNGAQWRVTRGYANASGGSWVVETNGSLNSPGTFAACANFS